MGGTSSGGTTATCPVVGATTTALPALSRPPALVLPAAPPNAEAPALPPSVIAAAPPACSPPAAPPPPTFAAEPAELESPELLQPNKALASATVQSSESNLCSLIDEHRVSGELGGAPFWL